MQMRMINIPPHPQRQIRRRGPAPPQPFPLPPALPPPSYPPPPPPPIAFTDNSSTMASRSAAVAFTNNFSTMASESAAGSSSVAPVLGPGFVPIIPRPHIPPLASSSRLTLDSAQLRALYVPLPRGHPSVSCNYLYLSFLLNFANN